MTRKANSNPLAERLAQLSITPAELAAAVRVDVETVEDWIENGPDAEAVVKLRFLKDDADALRRATAVRRKHTTDLRGDGMTYAGIEGVPYGTGDIGKLTGGGPQ